MSDRPSARWPEGGAQAEIERLRALVETQAASAQAEQERLTFELGHRVRNTLGIVQALASQTLRAAASPQDAIEALNHRILSLARANDAILAESWTNVSLDRVARRVLDGCGAGPLAIEGPDLRIPAGAALSFAMALHELATNARRHGAWTVPGGCVALRWQVAPGPAGDRLALTWYEQGGPTAAAPSKRGFGLRLIEQSLRSAFGRDVALCFEPTGFACRVAADLPDLVPAA